MRTRADGDIGSRVGELSSEGTKRRVATERTFVRSDDGAMKTWLVERTPDNFDRVHANAVAFQGGVVMFLVENEQLGLALAPGEWLSVVPDEA